MSDTTVIRTVTVQAPARLDGRPWLAIQLEAATPDGEWRVAQGKRLDPDYPQPAYQVAARFHADETRWRALLVPQGGSPFGLDVTEGAFGRDDRPRARLGGPR